ncbi:MAG: 16S rRNA (cytidine(1402)-2'-O)-methyltransferase [bacterium]
MAGTLYIVATPIGNLEDITARAMRILREVDLIACEDTRHTKKLLSKFDIHTPLTSFFKGNEGEKVLSIIAALTAGRNVALVSDAGTPCVSDPGFPLLARAAEEGILIVPVPGPSALAAAISAAGLPTDRFTFAGFLPDKPGKRMRSLEELAALDHTVVLYVSPWKAIAVLKDCLAAFGDRRACLCREITKIHEEFIRGTLQEILDAAEERKLKGEMTLVIAGKSYSR